jgi:hypothetical protein
MKILMVLTSHDKLGNTGRKTGFWLEEFAAPYFTFKDAGAEIVLASPKGGQPPLDPKSNEPNFQTELTRRFEADADAKAQLATTLRLESVKAEDFDTSSTRVVMGRCGISPRTRTRSSCWNPSWPPARPLRWSATLPARCAMSRPRTAGRWFKARP